MSDLAPFVASLLRDKTMDDLMEENRKLRETLDQHPPSDLIDSEALTVCLVDNEGETRFTINNRTRMQKVFDAYAKKKSKAPAAGHFRFTVNGTNIVGYDTPARLRMKSNCAVLVSPAIKLKIVDPEATHQKATTFVIGSLLHDGMRIPLSRVFTHYAGRAKFDIERMQFLYKGREVRGTATMSSLGADEDAIVKVVRRPMALRRSKRLKRTRQGERR